MGSILTQLKIRELLKELTDAQLKQLKCALEQDIAQYVIIYGNTFVGVNIHFLKNLDVQDSHGAWSCGVVL